MPQSKRYGNNKAADEAASDIDESDILLRFFIF